MEISYSSYRREKSEPSFEISHLEYFCFLSFPISLVGPDFPMEIRTVTTAPSLGRIRKKNSER